MTWDSTEDEQGGMGWEAHLRANLEARFEAVDFRPGDALPYDEVVELIVLVATGLREEMLRLSAIADRIRFAMRHVSPN